MTKLGSGPPGVPPLAADLVRHYPHAAINDAVADMLAGTAIKAVLQIDTV